MPKQLKLFFLCALSAGCSFDKAISDQARLGCAADRECPGGLKCQTGLSVCVSSAAFDGVPPDVVAAELTLLPLPANPLSAPTALGPASVAHLRVTTSEVLSALPMVAPTSATGTPATLACTVSATTAQTIFEVVCTSAGATNGVVTLNLDLLDLAHNAARASSPRTVTLDLDAPAAPLSEGLSVRSAPWGDAYGNTAASMSLLGDAGVTTGAQFVRARVDGLVTAVAAVASDGHFEPVPLPLVEGSVEVQAIDEAGNVSPWARVHELTWVANFLQKQAASQVANPHRFEVVRASADGLEGYPVTERGDADGIAQAGGPVVIASGAGTWSRRNVSQEAEGATSPSAAWDPLRSRVVRFGGSVAGKPAGSLWEWLGRDWLSPPIADPEGDGQPAAREGAQLAWDWARRAMVLTGGSSLGVLRDTWAWSGSSWVRLADAPSGRSGGALVPDSSHGGVIAFGGLGADGGVNLSAERLTASSTWAVVDASAFPPARAYAATATDPTTGTSWLFGGATGPSLSAVLGDLWVFSKGQWAHPALGTPGPSARHSAAMTYDTRRGRLVLFGGTNPAGSDTADLWEWDGAIWSQRAFTNGPSARSQHQLVFDEARNQTLLIAGKNPIVGRRDETWAWDGTRWLALATPTIAPERLVSLTMAYDRPTNAVITVASNAQLDRFTLAQLGEEGWSAVNSSVGANGLGAYLVSDPLGDNASLVGPITSGLQSTLWSIDTNGGWSERSSALGITGDQLKGAFSGHGSPRVVANNSGVGSIVNGVLVNPQPFPAAFDQQVSGSLPDGGALIVGIAGTASVVEFWSELGFTPAPALPSVVAPWAVVFDPARNRPLVVGGRTFPSLKAVNTVFELTGAEWSTVPIADPEGDDSPELSSPPLVAAHLARQRTMVIERGPQAETGTVWELDIAHQRPQITLRFALQSLPTGAQISEMSLVFAGGASGLGSDGVELFERQGGAWVASGGQNQAPADAPLPLVFTTTDPARIARLSGAGGELCFAIRSKSTNGSGLSRLAVDGPQLQMRLRLP